MVFCDKRYILLPIIINKYGYAYLIFKPQSNLTLNFEQSTIKFNFLTWYPVSLRVVLCEWYAILSDISLSIVYGLVSWSVCHPGYLFYVWQEEGGDAGSDDNKEEDPAKSIAKAADVGSLKARLERIKQMANSWEGPGLAPVHLPAHTAPWLTRQLSDTSDTSSTLHGHSHDMGFLWNLLMCLIWQCSFFYLCQLQYCAKKSCKCFWLSVYIELQNRFYFKNYACFVKQEQIVDIFNLLFGVLLLCFILCPA